MQIDFLNNISSVEFQLAVASIAILAGIFLLLKGGNWTVNSACWIADSFGVSRFFIAATVLAFGTSAPELFISVNANFSGFPSLSIGSVIGSNIANILLVVGISSIVVPVFLDRTKFRKDALIMVLSAAVLAAGMTSNRFDRIAGAMMLLLLVLYLIIEFRGSHIDKHSHKMDTLTRFQSKFSASCNLILGFASLLLGAELLVHGAVEAGKILGVRESVIGMTVVAFGTSLSELAICLAAARKNQTDMLLGGIIGSNIFNILCIIGLTALLKPLVVDREFLNFDLQFAVAVTLAFAMLLTLSNRIPKFAGIAFIAAYVFFIFTLYWERMSV